MLTGVPRELRCWLLDRASLTHRVRQACPGRFQVELVSQGFVPPMRNERRALRMRPAVRALVREVRLVCDGRPWVFARTVIPNRTLHGAQRQLGRLGTRPLGAVLFADRSMRRGEVQLARIRPGERMFDAAVGCRPQRPDAIWGRRSTFHVGGKPLLVTEVFLPDVGGCPRF